jgi:uncharacterized protein YjiS (DUF1127 family)
MLVTTLIHFAPRTVAQARAARAAHLGRRVRRFWRRLSLRLAALRQRIAVARQYERELAVLLQADDRMLRDIGVTRGEVLMAAQSRWFIPGDATDGAARRRSDAMRAAEARRALPRVAAPALTPAAPVQFVETSNFR